MKPLADPREVPGTRAPLGPISFIFMQFSAKVCQIIAWRTPLGNPGSTTGNNCCYNTNFPISFFRIRENACFLAFSGGRALI